MREFTLLMSGKEAALRQRIDTFLERFQKSFSYMRVPLDAYSALLFVHLVKNQSLEYVLNRLPRFIGADTWHLQEFRFNDDMIDHENWKDQESLYNLLTSLNPLIESLYHMVQLDQNDFKTEFNDLFFEDNYPTLVDATLQHGLRIERFPGGEMLQPGELTELILAIANIQPGESVYNPFAGLASFGVMLRKDAQYFGQEINHRTWALGTIRLLAHRSTSNCVLRCEDSISDWNSEKKQYDLVVANPPFNVLVNHMLDKVTSSKATIESFFLQEAIRDAKDSGKVMCVVPLNFLSSVVKHQGLVRKWIVDEGLLDCVVEFPGGLLNFSSIPFVLLVIDKARDRQAPVRMVDASQFVITLSRSDNRIRVDALFDAIQGSPDDEVVKLVDAKSIRSNGYNLRPLRYLLFEKDLLVRGVRLGEHATPVKLNRFETGSEAPFIRIRDLQEDPFNTTSLLDKVEVSPIPNHAKRLDRSALLLAMRWNSLKPTWFEYSGVPVAISNDILVLEVDEDKVDPAYLVHELMSPKVQTQVKQLTRGLTIPSLRRQDILDLRIELPTILEQQAKVKGLREAHVENLRRRALDEAERHGVRLQQFGNTVSFKHRLGTPLLAVGSGIDLVVGSLDRIHPNWRAHIVSPRQQLSLGAIMDNIANELQRISAMLDADSLELEVEKYPLAPLDLVSFARKATRKVQANLNGGYDADFFISADIKDHLHGKAPIQGNRELLDIAMDALVDNARRHGFAGQPGPHKLAIRVGLRVEDNGTWLVLTVANSGRPFPEGFGLERFVRKNVHAGPTGHTGIGGHHLQEIMQYHKGHIELSTGNQLSGSYATAIDLIFPLAH